MSKTNLARSQTEFLVRARVRNRKRMTEASKSIDKLKRRTSGPNSVQIVRKFRGKI